ncbi:hypothetical protein [Paenibacillus illinoisensis]|uniref:hypothetical protein n=1 Tax=Paenibacillus illinoisensis TaxID=59845 RepID=UPI00301A1F90
MAMGHRTQMAEGIMAMVLHIWTVATMQTEVYITKLSIMMQDHIAMGLTTVTAQCIVIHRERRTQMDIRKEG